MPEKEPPMAEGGEPERQEPIEKTEMPEIGVQKQTTPEAPTQQQQPSIDKPIPTKKQILYARALSKLNTAGVPTKNEAKQSETPTPEKKIITDIRYYPIKVPMADTTPKQLIDKPIRILNPQFIEKISDDVIRDHPGLVKNKIQISAKAEISFNKTELELHKYTIAALNIAMATCAHPALTLDSAYKKIDRGESKRENEMHKERLHFAFVRLLDTGVIYYNPLNKTAIRLLPTVIEDSRLFNFLK